MIVIVIVMLGGDLISWGNCLPGRCSFHGSPLHRCKPCILHGVATDGSEIHAPSVTHCVGQKTSQMCPALGIHVVPSSPCGLVEIFQMHFFGTERRPPVFVGVFLKIFKRTCTHSSSCLEWSFVFQNRVEECQNEPHRYTHNLIFAGLSPQQ